MNAESVDVGLHHVAQCVEDHAVAGERRFAGEGGCHDRHIEVTATISRTLMPCVEMALVFDEKALRRERLIQQGLDTCDPVRAHGSTRLKGLTTTSL